MFNIYYQTWKTIYLIDNPIPMNELKSHPKLERIQSNFEILNFKHRIRLLNSNIMYKFDRRLKAKFDKKSKINQTYFQLIKVVFKFKFVIFWSISVLAKH